MKMISKSQYLKGIQCPRALWLYRNKKDLASEIGEGRQFIFDTGHEVGVLAQKYFGEGIEITEPYYKINQAIRSTEKAVRRGKDLIFEDLREYCKLDTLAEVRLVDVLHQYS